MGETKTLMQGEALRMIKRIAKGEMAMLCTFATDASLSGRPMSTAAVDDDGSIWFMSRDSSEKNRHIASDPRVHLTYAVTGKSEYLFLEGRAAIVRDQVKINELWSPLAKTWFNEGKTDPSITLIRVSPVRGHYWDTKHNKMVQLAEIAMGALLGRPMDGGIDGELRP